MYRNNASQLKVTCMLAIRSKRCSITSSKQANKQASNAMKSKRCSNHLKQASKQCRLAMKSKRCSNNLKQISMRYKLAMKSKKCS